MTGRRRYPRFLVAAPIDGTLRLREEVAIERWGESEMDVVSAVACECGERLTLEMPGTGAKRLFVTVRESQPVVAPDGSIYYRLRMSIGEPDAAPPEGHRRW